MNTSGSLDKLPLSLYICGGEPILFQRKICLYLRNVLFLHSDTFIIGPNRIKNGRSII